MDLLIGAVLGIGSSFFAWWFVAHKIVPIIKFSSAISSRPQKANSEHRYYRIKFKNVGRRAIIGVEVFARLTIKWEAGRNWNAYYIPLNSAGDRKYELPLLGRDRNRILSLWFSRSDAIQNSKRFPQAVRTKAANKTLKLEELLALGETANLQIFLSGYDEFSGARKVFVSRKYRKSDVQQGYFRGLEVEGKQTEEGEQKESTDLEAPVDSKH